MKKIWIRINKDDCPTEEWHDGPIYTRAMHYAPITLTEIQEKLGPSDLIDYSGPDMLWAVNQILSERIE